MSGGDDVMLVVPPPKEARSKRRAGRPATHGMRSMRRALSQLMTRRLDGRSAIAVAVRRWKEDVRADLGGDLTRAQETILELAAQSWVVLMSIDDYIARQPSLVTKKRQLLPVVVQRMQMAEGLARQLERLGLERRAKDLDITAEIAALQRARERDEAGSRPAPDAAAKQHENELAPGLRVGPSVCRP